MNTGFDAYLAYRAIVQHFKNAGYDYFKYHGRVRGATIDNYERSHERFQFDKLARWYPNKTDLENFIVANVIANNAYVRDMVIDGEDVYLKWKRRTQSLNYMVRNDIKTILSECPKFRNALRVIDRQHPLIFQACSRGEICVETVIYLDEFTGFFKRVDEELSWEQGWRNFSEKVAKYRPFLRRLNIDVGRLKQTIRQTLEEEENGRTTEATAYIGAGVSDGRDSSQLCTGR